MVPDGPPAPPGGQHSDGRLRHPLSLPAQRHWALNGIEETAHLGTVLHVSGADLLDGTPIFDIKPYLPYTDAHPDATVGFTQSYTDYHLEVIFPPDLLEQVPTDLRPALTGVLAQDPRPSYQDDPERVYGMAFGGLEVKFKVCEKTLAVVSVEKSSL